MKNEAIKKRQKAHLLQVCHWKFIKVSQGQTIDAVYAATAYADRPVY
jgi:hypothetical protein